MVRTLLAALMSVILLSTPAFAADDGRFGVGKMASGSSKAFNDPSAETPFDPSAVEPAAGTEDDVPPAPEDITTDKNANSADAPNSTNSSPSDDADQTVE